MVPGACHRIAAGRAVVPERDGGRAGVLTAPEAANAASRRVLEKNGFRLAAVRPIATEPHGRPMAIYRLPPTTKVR